MKQDNTALLEAIEKIKKVTYQHAYTLSIGEIRSLYKNYLNGEDSTLILPSIDSELSDKEKTIIIERILAGLPVKEIYLQQDSDGNWILLNEFDLVLTILEFFGVLPNKEPLVLKKGVLIPKLKGVTFDSLPIEIQLNFKRTRVNSLIMLFGKEEKENMLNLLGLNK